MGYNLWEIHFSGALRNSNHKLIFLDTPNFISLILLLSSVLVLNIIRSMCFPIVVTHRLSTAGSEWLGVTYFLKGASILG